MWYFFPCFHSFGWNLRHHRKSRFLSNDLMVFAIKNHGFCRGLVIGHCLVTGGLTTKFGSLARPSFSATAYNRRTIVSRYILLSKSEVDVAEYQCRCRCEKRTTANARAENNRRHRRQLLSVLVHHGMIGLYLIFFFSLTHGHNMLNRTLKG